MKVHLKVKIKSLADEARIIKAEERRLKPKPLKPGLRKRLSTVLAQNDLDVHERASLKRRARKPTANQVAGFWSCRDHRLNVVRPEARRTLVAYGFMRGLDYLRIENPRPENKLTNDDWGAIKSMVVRHAPRAVKDRVAVESKFDIWMTKSLQAWEAVPRKPKVTVPAQANPVAA